MAPPIVRDVSLSLGRGGIDPGGSVLSEALVGCYTGRGSDPCTVTVNFGPTTSYGTSSVPTPTGASHVVPISVTPGGVTHFRFVATSVPGAEVTTTGDYAFTATPGALVAGPGITPAGGTAGTITASGATITWTTATAQPRGAVRYSATPFAADKPGAATTNEAAGAPLTSHSVALTGLTGATRYYFRVVQTDATGGTTIGTLQSFVTA